VVADLSESGKDIRKVSIVVYILRKMLTRVCVISSAKAEIEKQNYMLGILAFRLSRRCRLHCINDMRCLVLGGRFRTLTFTAAKDIFCRCSTCQWQRETRWQQEFIWQRYCHSVPHLLQLSCCRTWHIYLKRRLWRHAH